MLVVTAVSSINTRWAGSRKPCSRIQRRRARAMSARSPQAAGMTYEGRPLRAFFTCGPQFGRTSVPIIPQRVQTIREQSRTGVSSGSRSP